MLLWVFFENLGKGLYTPTGYAGLINYYIKASHCPAAWKAVMALAANHAAIAAPMQGLTELSLGILLIIGLLTRPAATVAFLFLGSLWISEFGTSWIWELLVPVLASLGLAVGRLVASAEPRGQAEGLAARFAGRGNSRGSASRGDRGGNSGRRRAVARSGRIRVINSRKVQAHAKFKKRSAWHLSVAEKYWAARYSHVPPIEDSPPQVPE